MKIPFIKMHGLGNDFVFLKREDFYNHYSKEFITKISNRNLGIGCDQLVIYYKQYNEYYIEIFNSNGTTALACGNATRCLASHLMEIENKTTLVLNISNRKVYCNYIAKNICSVNMGKALFKNKWIPKKEKLWNIAKKYEIHAKDIICVDMGNPHIVIFSTLSKEDKELIAEQLQNQELFPDGININFVTIIKEELHVKTWERGVGFTLACGSGSCASFAGAHYMGLINKNDTAIHLTLGTLRMHLDENSNIIMSGEVKKTAQGIYYI